MSKTEAAISIVREFVQTDPLKAAHAIETLQERDAIAILRSLSPSVSAQCLENTHATFAANALEKLPKEYSIPVLAKMSTFHAADILRKLPHETARGFLLALDPAFSKSMAEILNYPKDSAGRMMHTDFTAFRSDMRVREVITRLRQMARRHLPASYCYVVGPKDELLGVLNMRDLLLADGDAPLEAIMIRETMKVTPFADKEELVSIFAKKHFLAVPVVDDQGRLIGVVNTKNIIESTEQEATEDIQVLFGASPEERAHSGAWFKVRKRFPWLAVNLITAFLAGAVVALFEDFVARLAVLAVFLPIIAGQGGNAGTQTLAVVIRGMLMREITPANTLQLVRTEVLAGLGNGAATGFITAAAAWLWKGNPWLGAVVGFAMVVNMVAAGLAGALIPVVMKRLGHDPAHSSGIFLTTVTDVVGFFAFLSTAWLLQGKLL